MSPSMAQPLAIKPQFSIFDPKLTALVLKVLRKGRVAKSDLEDVFQVTQIEVQRCRTLPTQEPDRTKYILGIASNIATRYRAVKAENRENVALDLLRSVPAPTRGASLEARDLIAKHYAPEAARDPQAAKWTERHVVDGEKQTDIAAEDKVPVDRVRKRQERLLDRVRRAIGDTGDTALVVMLVMCAVAWWIRHTRPQTAESPPKPPVSQQDQRMQRAIGWRKQAEIDCGKQLWQQCLQDLDAAASDDPQGDAQPAVQQLRQRAESALAPAAPAPAPQIPDKPPTRRTHKPAARSDDTPPK